MLEAILVLLVKFVLDVVLHLVKRRLDRKRD